MKKLLLILTAVFAVTLSAQAQKANKEDKATQKAEQEAATQKLMQELFTGQNLQFVPTEAESATGGRVMINKYEYLRVRPDALQARMTGLSIEKNKGGFEVVKNEATKSGYAITIKLDNGNALLTLELVANGKTGMAVLKVKSNKSEDRIYRGSIREN